MWNKFSVAKKNLRVLRPHQLSGTALSQSEATGVVPVLTLSAVQRAGKRAGAPGQRPAHVSAQLLLGGRLAAASVLPEAAALGRPLAGLFGRLRLLRHRL